MGWCRQASSSPAHSRPCPRAAGEMKRVCLGGQNAQRSKDALPRLFFITRSLLRSATRGKRGVYAGVERRDWPSDLISMLLRAEGQPAHPGGWFRPNPHDPGTMRAMSLAAVAAWRAHMVIWVPRTLISPSTALSPGSRSRWEMGGTIRSAPCFFSRVASASFRRLLPN